MTSVELAEKRKDVDRNWNIYKRNKQNEEDRKLYYENYKLSRNQYTSLIRKLKSEYYEEKIDKVKYDSKLMWRCLKNIINLNNGVDNSLDKVVFDPVYDNLSITDKYNTYYTDILNDIEKSIPDMEEYNIYSGIEKPDSIFSEFQLITMDELKNLVFHQENKSSPDGVSSITIKNTFDVTGPHLFDIINTSLAEGVVARNWKKSTITPIPKTSNPTSGAETRPINKLPFVEKLCEKVVYNQLIHHFESNKLLNEQQYGFRKGRSTEAALQATLSEWRQALNEKKHVVVVMLDLKKAFETVNRSIFIEKLKCYGVEGTVLQWIEDYLSERSQEVKIQDEKSSELASEHGFPQGSCLAALFFLIYINDIFKIVKKKIKMKCFADDTLMYIIGDSLPESCNNMNEGLEWVSDWLVANKLKSNTSKSMAMLITTSQDKRIKLLQDHPEDRVKFENVLLEFQEVAKYLGVLVDYRLKFKEFIEYIAKKVAKKNGFLWRVGKHMSLWTRKLIYNTIIAPHFEYCSTILLDMDREDLNKLQVLQNNGMRAVLRSGKPMHRVDMLEKLEWLSVEQKIVFRVLMFIYDIMRGKIQCDFSEFMKKNDEIHNHNTRNAVKFHMSMQNNTAGQKSLFVNGLKIFNQIPQDFLELGRNLFKRKTWEFARIHFPL